MTETPDGSDGAAPSPNGEDEPRLLSRRAALGFIGASAAAAAIGIAVVRTDPGPEPALVQPGIPTADGSATSSTGGVAAVGEAYLADHPDEADEATLLAAIGIAPDAFGDPNAQLDALADQIHADFGAGDTVQVSAWALSLTEARLAALVALQSR